MKQLVSDALILAVAQCIMLILLSSFAFILGSWLCKDDVMVQIAYSRGAHWQFDVLSAIHLFFPLILAAEIAVGIAVIIALRKVRAE